MWLDQTGHNRQVEKWISKAKQIDIGKITCMFIFEKIENIEKCTN